MRDLDQHSPVLVAADDGEAFRLIIRNVLKSIGLNCHLTAVKDGMELMEFLHHEGRYKHSITPDLIVLDLNMPNKDGRTALREIKADPVLCSIPVVIMTSSVMNDDVELCRQFECQYVIKPTEYSEWVKLIRRILKTHLEI